jgi:hypothetical protein
MFIESLIHLMNAREVHNYFCTKQQKWIRILLHALKSFQPFDCFQIHAVPIPEIFKVHQPVCL